MTGPVLTTSRLTLTPIGLSDFDDLFELWQDDAFTRHITGRALSREEVWFRLLRDIGHWQALGYGNWSIRLLHGGAYLGSVGILDFRRDLTPAFDAPELGWGIGAAYQGKGYAHEALAAALAWADAFPNARTVCMIAPDNAPSIALAGRVGYAPYAETTYKDTPVVLYERLKD